MLETRHRYLLFILILGLILFVGLLFADWILPNLILPVAMAVWIFLRIFILSLDQKLIWWFLTITGFSWLIYQLIPKSDHAATEDPPLLYHALSSQKTWQANLLFARTSNSERDSVRQKMILLLTAFYAARQPGTSLIEIRQALENQQLDLPDSLHRFLFPVEPGKRHRLSPRTAVQVFRRWYREISGKEAAEFSHKIDELIQFMESSMESSS